MGNLGREGPRVSLAAFAGAGSASESRPDAAVGPLLGRRERAEAEAPFESQPPPPGGGSQRRLGDLLARVGRLVLWAAIGVLLIRGVGAVLSAPTRSDPRALTATPALADLEAQAFAVRFTRAYLTFTPRRRAAWAGTLAPYLASGLRDRAAAALPRKGPGQRVAQATVARVAFLGGTRALITVASTFTDPARPARYLSVPIARDQAGGLSVFDLPALSAPPRAGSVSFTDPPPLTGADAGEIRDLVSRFLGAYLSGRDPSGLGYFAAPGVLLAPMAPGLVLVSVDSLGQDSDPAGMSGSVLAAVQVRDTRSGVSYALRYRVGLVHRDRWYVSSVAGGPSSEWRAACAPRSWR